MIARGALVGLIRSKSADPFELMSDIVFEDEGHDWRIQRSDALSRETDAAR